MMTKICRKPRKKNSGKPNGASKIFSESFSDAFFTADREWRFTYINRHAEQILGRPADELLGKNMWEEFPEAVGTDIYDHYQKAVAEQVTINFETFYPPFDAWFEVRAYPSHDGGLSVYFHNISDRNTPMPFYANRKNAIEFWRKRLRMRSSELTQPARSNIQTPPLKIFSATPPPNCSVSL